MTLYGTNCCVCATGRTATDGRRCGPAAPAARALDKGNTEIAIYGLGHQRDERLARVFATEECGPMVCTHLC